MATLSSPGPVRWLQCPCGVRFTWRSEDAGHDLRCTCGRLLVVPSTRPGGESMLLVEQPNVRDRRTQAPRMLCPVCCNVMKRNDRVCIHCGFDRREGRRVRVQTDRPLTKLELELAEEARRETRSTRLASIGAIGVALAAALLVRPMLGGITFAQSAAMFLPWALISTAAMCIGLWVVHWWADYTTDDLPTMLLAVAAIAVNAFQWRALTFELLHISEPTNGLSALAMLAPLAVCFIIVPGAMVYILATYLLRPDSFAGTIMALALWFAESTMFLMMRLAFNMPW